KTNGRRAGPLVRLYHSRQGGAFQADRAAIHDQRNIGGFRDLPDALGDLRDRQQITIGQTKIFVNRIARQVRRRVTAVLYEPREQSIGYARRDGALGVPEDFTQASAFLLIGHWGESIPYRR